MVNKKTGSKEVAKLEPVKTGKARRPEPKKTFRRPVAPAPVKAAPVKPAAKSAVAKKAVKTAVAKATPKKVAAAKPVAKSVVAKKAAKSAVAKPVQNAVSTLKTAAAKPVVAAPVKKVSKDKSISLVTIVKKAAPVTKKEPKKTTKVVVPKTIAKTAVKYEPDFTKSILDRNHKFIEQETGPTLRYSDSDLVEFKEIIARKLDAAKKELNYLQGLITRRDDLGDIDEARYMTLEDGSVSMEREQLSQMASRQINFIDHLEKAMMRIENKTYGVCRVTGKLIDKARLKAVPHATLSIEAKQMMNK